jgi:hypothetical protein
MSQGTYLTPYHFVVFTFGFAIKSIKEFGGVSKVAKFFIDVSFKMLRK